MFTAWLRQVSRWFVEPLAAFLARLGLTPNALTVIGCLLNLVVAVIIARGDLLWGGIALAAASGFDAMDGAVARKVGQATKFGAFLDSVLDRVSESAVLLGLAYYDLQQGATLAAFLAFVAIVGSMLVSYTRARAEGLGVDCKVGFLTRVERCLLLIVALIANLTVPALWILAVGTVFTSIQRIWHVHRLLAGDTL
jgi:CDP-diacylglycerol--glycerol-3-phosphate 3-phosphatidyltransferase